MQERLAALMGIVLHLNQCIEFRDVKERKNKLSKKNVKKCQKKM